MSSSDKGASTPLTLVPVVDPGEFLSGDGCGCNGGYGGGSGGVCECQEKAGGGGGGS